MVRSSAVVSTRVLWLRLVAVTDLSPGMMRKPSLSIFTVSSPVRTPILTTGTTSLQRRKNIKKKFIHIIFIYLFIYLYIYIYSEKSSTYLIGPPSCTTGILISDIVSIICPVRVSMVTSSSSLCARWRVSCYIQYK